MQTKTPPTKKSLFSRFGDWFDSLSPIEQDFGILAIVFSLVAAFCYLVEHL